MNLLSTRLTAPGSPRMKGNENQFEFDYSWSWPGFELLVSNAKFNWPCYEPWNTETHKTDRNAPITNQKPWPFEPVKVKFCFLRGPLRWLTAAKNAIVSWVLNFRIRMSVKRAVHFQAFTFNYLFVKFLQKTNKSWPLSRPGWTLFIHEPRLDAANQNVGILNLRVWTKGISSFRSIPGRTDNEHVHRG